MNSDSASVVGCTTKGCMDLRTNLVATGSYIAGPVGSFTDTRSAARSIVSDAPSLRSEKSWLTSVSSASAIFKATAIEGTLSPRSTLDK